jgi:hypothetical protein
MLFPHISAAQGKKLHLQIIEVTSANEAQKILEDLRRGADFSRLAKQRSTDSTATDGGYMGSIDPSTLRHELGEALRGLSPGMNTGVIKLPSSFAILRILPEAPTQARKTESASIAMAAYGNVRPSANTSGMLEAELAFQNLPKPLDWGHDLQAICRYRTESLEKNQAMLAQYLFSAKVGENGVGSADLVQAQFALAQLYTYEGKMERAQELLRALYGIVSQNYPSFLPQLVEALGINQFHGSEMKSNVYSNPGERCLVPTFRKTTVQPAKEHSEIETFSSYLKHMPNDLEVRWLLNLAYMHQGGYPEQVPPEFLIAPDVFGTEKSVGRFKDVAPEVGLDDFAMAGGLIVDDFDNDGLLDVIKSSFNMCDRLRYFKNEGNGTFLDRSRQAGFDLQLGGLNVIQADYDNDRCLDVLVLRGGWEWPMRRSLLKGNCRGEFNDVTRESGLLEPLAASQSAVWADFDNDGYLDLFVANERGPAQLFWNKRNGTFEEIGKAAGVDRSTFAKAVVAADYDGDGWADFYVSNLFGDNLLYKNNRNRTFKEVAGTAGVQKPLASFAAWFFDYDNDGWQDLFVTSYYMSTEETVRSLLKMPVNAETLKLYRNLGNGTFEDTTAAAGLDRVLMPMGGNFGDFDNDGFLDMYMGSGSPTLVALVPYVLWHNQAGKRFVDVTTSAGVGEIHKGHGVAFASLRNDGQEDILTVVGGAVPSDAHAMRVFASPGNDNDWIELKLVGVKSNRSAIGAKIRVVVEYPDSSKRVIHRIVGSGGSFGASPLRQHIGLGNRAKVRELTIDWPVSHARQRFTNVRVNQLYEITESSDKYRPIAVKKVVFGARR